MLGQSLLTAKAAINASLEANVVAQNRLQSQQPAFPPFEYRQPSTPSAHSPANSVEGTDWSSPTLNDFAAERDVTDAFVSILRPSKGGNRGCFVREQEPTLTCG